MVDLTIKIDNVKAVPRYGLEKLPDDILLKDALMEIGKQKSYIDELEYMLCPKGINTFHSLKARLQLLEKENSDLKSAMKQLRKRKVEGSCAGTILLSEEDKVRLREVAYKNNLVLAIKRERDAFKAQVDILKAEVETVKSKYWKIIRELNK